MTNTDSSTELNISSNTDELAVKPATIDPRTATSTPKRVLGYDLARSLAIVGMVLINFQGHLGESSEIYNGIGAWLANLPSGRASSLFVTLAGAGIALMDNGAPRRAVRWTLLRRSVFLLVAGYALRELWSIDILHFYGFYLLVAGLVFLSLPKRALLPLAFAIIVAAGILTELLEDVVDHSVGHFSAQGIAQDAIGWGIHPLLPWLAFILVGMWIGKHDLNDAGTRRALMLRGGAVALGAHYLSVLAGWLGPAGLLPLEWLHFVGTGWSPEPLFAISAAGTAMFIIASAQELITRRPDNRVLLAMIATGQLSLTVYVAHALLGVELWTWQTDWFDEMPHPGVVAYALGFCLVAVVLVSLYRRKLRRGPLEWIMRKICGSTPKKVDAMQLHTLTAPGPTGGYVAAVAVLFLVGFQFVGVTLRPGCREPIELTGADFAGLSLTCGQQEFTLNTEALVEVTLRTWSGLDLYMELYDGDELIAENDDYEGDLDARVWARLEPGAYRVVIRPYASAIGGFTFTTEFTEPEEIPDGFLCSNACDYAGDSDCDDGGPDHDYYICDFGTDCEDCGPRDPTDEPPPPEPGTEICNDECRYADDGDCDDGGPDSDYAVCRFGSDCGDCGMRIAP